LQPTGHYEDEDKKPNISPPLFLGVKFIGRNGAEKAQALRNGK
jgi:hypothetical protein